MDFHTQRILGSAVAVIVFKMLFESQASCARDFHLAQLHVRNKAKKRNSSIPDPPLVRESKPGVSINQLSYLNT